MRLCMPLKMTPRRHTSVVILLQYRGFSLAISTPAAETSRFLFLRCYENRENIKSNARLTQRLIDALKLRKSTFDTVDTLQQRGHLSGFEVLNRRLARAAFEWNGEPAISRMLQNNFSQNFHRTRYFCLANGKSRE